MVCYTTLEGKIMSSNFGKELAKDALRIGTHQAAKAIGWSVGSLIVMVVVSRFVSPEVGIGAGGATGLLAFINSWRGLS